MKHLLIEANCMYWFEETKEEVNNLECCKFGIGNISLNCLKYDETSNKMCPYLAFGTPSTTLALTDKSGEVINAETFFDDFDLSSEEWERREEEWIKRCNNLINKL